MKPFLSTLAIALLLCVHVQGLENLLGTPIQKCINCLCHARSGCWSRFNCARYSISLQYWQKAGSPTVGNYVDDNDAYKACMGNENCILNCVKNYSEKFGPLDCNCDGVYDCKDRLAIHLFGESCMNPKFGSIYANRFNDCADQVGVAPMSANEGACIVPRVAVF